VTFNSALVIDTCLDALRRQAPDVAVIVVDNASSDDTVERVDCHQGLRSITNKTNLGFAAAVNQGARLAADADFILVLNPDVELVTSLEPLIRACQVHGIAAGQLTDSEGRPQAGFTIRRLPTATALIFELFGLNRLWKSNPVNRNYRYLERNLQQPGPVEQPAGAFMMIRRDVWERLGGMDESFYPVWFEDVDFCRRALDAGVRIEYVPSVTARHRGGHSVGALPPGCRALYWCDSLQRYAAKHFRANQFRGVCAAVLLSSVARGLLGIVRERNLELLTVSMRIARMALRHVLSGQAGQIAVHGD
jgi:GT2 family glycosyltransferase